MLFPLEDLLPRIAFLWGRGFKLNCGWNVAFLGLCKCIANITAAGLGKAVGFTCLTGRVLVPRMCAAPLAVGFLELVRRKPEMGNILQIGSTFQLFKHPEFSIQDRRIFFQKSFTCSFALRILYINIKFSLPLKLIFKGYSSEEKSVLLTLDL